VEETLCLVTHCCECTGISLICYEHKKQKSLCKGNGFGIFVGV